MCPYVGSLSLAFLGPPSIKVQLLPYNRVRLMRIPILQARPPGRSGPYFVSCLRTVWVA